MNLIDELERDMQIAVNKRLEEDGFAFVNDILEDIEFDKRIGINRKPDCNFIYPSLSDNKS